MKLRGVLMAGALLDAAFVLSAIADEAPVPVAPVLKGPAFISGWEFGGAADFGWLSFIERPPLAAAPCTVTPNSVVVGPGNTTSVLVCPSRETRSKFEEYGNFTPGPHLDYLYLWGLSKDPRDGLGYEFWAKDVGYNNQSYLLSLSKAGEHYLWLGFDQTPHIWSTSALSIWGGAPDALTTCCIFPKNPLSTFGVQNSIENAILDRGQFTTIGTQRYTGSLSYLWTPTRDADYSIDYTPTRRTGTVAQWGIIETGFGSPAVQLPRPVDDWTHDIRASGEYRGYTPWGSKYSAQLAYNGSIYVDDYSFFTWQNPFVGTPATNCDPQVNCVPNPDTTHPPMGFLSLAPNNQAHGVSLTTGVDLPFGNRYAGTASYTMLRQNEAFGPQTVNPFITQAQLATIALPATSLNGAINTLLLNNVITSQISPDLRSTLKYRFYDLMNETPTLTFAGYVLGDVTVKNTPPDLPIRNLVISYSKQNASEDLTWRPNRWLSVGAGAGWERWDRDHMDANVTNEWSGKVYADARSFWGLDWANLRSSYQFSARRYETYDYLDYVARVIYVSPTEVVNSSLMRMFDMANRDRQQGKVQLTFDTDWGATITPNGGFKLDDYQHDSAVAPPCTIPIPATANPDTQCFGIESDHSLNAGVEFAYSPVPRLTFLASYTREQHNEQLIGAGNLGMNLGGVHINSSNSSTYDWRMRNGTDTVSLAVNVEVIPYRLDVKGSYTFSHDVEHWDTTIISGTPSDFAPYPDVINNFQRADAIVKYIVDPDLVVRLGWTGDVIAKLQYTWMRNSVTNWQYVDVPNMFFIDNSVNRMISFAGVTPNFNVQMIMSSLAIKW